MATSGKMGKTMCSEAGEVINMQIASINKKQWEKSFIFPVCCVHEIIAKNCCVSVITVNIRRDSKDGNDGICVPPQERRGLKNLKEI
jgi:hypothetical protein